MMPDNLAEWIGCAFAAAVIIFEILIIVAMIRDE